MTTEAEMLVRLARAQQEVKSLGKQIGEALRQCTGIKGGLAYSTDNVYGLPMQKDPSEITHLKQAYSPEVRDSGSGYDYMEEDEIAYFLAESCPHCLHAHELIQTRKKARRRLGNAKAAISRRAKELLDKHNIAAHEAA